MMIICSNLSKQKSATTIDFTRLSTFRCLIFKFHYNGAETTPFLPLSVSVFDRETYNRIEFYLVSDLLNIA